MQDKNTRCIFLKHLVRCQTTLHKLKDLILLNSCTVSHICFSSHLIKSHILMKEWRYGVPSAGDGCQSVMYVYMHSSIPVFAFILTKTLFLSSRFCVSWKWKIRCYSFSQATECRISLLCKTAIVLLPLCALAATLFQNNVAQANLIAWESSKR